MTFYFNKQITRDKLGRTLTNTANGLEFRLDGGTRRVMSVSLVELTHAGMSKNVIVKVGLSFFRGQVRPFVCGSLIPDDKIMPGDRKEKF